MKNILVILTLILSVNLVAQEKQIPILKKQEGFFKLDFLSIDMPELRILNEPNMGFAGIHYNLKFDNFYTGVGIYGSVSGARGGFFTLGVDAGYKQFLSDKLFLDAGFHFGGGGGAAAADGGGAFILPHLNLGYEFENFSLSTGYSYMNFFDGGQIKGSQLNFEIQFPMDFEYANHTNLEQQFATQDFKDTYWNQKSNSVSAMLHLNNYRVLSDLPSTEGEILKGKTIRLAGFELAKYGNKNFLYFLKLSGAYSGIRAGYMDVFLGAGYQLSFNRNRTNVLTKFAIGAGGGGGVNTSGGFMIQPDITIEQQLFNSVFLTVNGGYLTTRDSKFEVATFGLGLKYKTNLNGTFNDEKQFTSSIFKGVEVIVKQDVYLDAIRDNFPTENLYQIAVQINLNIYKNLYLAGQTAFANFGNAGAYAEGIVGLGVNTNPILNNKVRLFTQFLAGAAGGGDITTNQGLIIKPSAGFSYELTDKFALRASAGYVKTRGNGLSSPAFNLGLKYSLSFLQSE